MFATRYATAMLAQAKSTSHRSGNRLCAKDAGRQRAALKSTVRRELTVRRDVGQRYLASLATLKPVVPNVVMIRRLPVTGGDRHIVILHLGAGPHLSGELVVGVSEIESLVTSA